MSWTHDRSIRDNRVLLIVVFVLAAAVTGGFYFWSRVHTREDVQNQSVPRGNSVIQPAFRTEPLSVTFYYPHNGTLASATASAKRQPDTQAQAGEALAVIFSDPRGAQAEVIKDLRLAAFFLDERGTAYVDLAAKQAQGVHASSWDEELAIYSLVNTLMQNFEEIKRVIFLVDGKEAATLAGHVDLARAYTKRMDLVTP